jgi:hypothetical protein
MAKRKKAARKEATGAFVETLEPRVLLSAVTLTTVGNTLLIRGDNNANTGDGFTLSQNANGAIMVTGDASTTVINNAKTLVTGTTAGTIQNISIVTGDGDDSVTIVGAVTNIKNFNANLGGGDNSLVNQGNIDALGTITIVGQQATPATGTVTLDTHTTVSTASVTTDKVSFNVLAAGATGSVSILSFVANAAKGTVAIPNWGGQLRLQLGHLQ